MYSLVALRGSVARLCCRIRCPVDFRLRMAQEITKKIKLIFTFKFTQKINFSLVAFLFLRQQESSFVGQSDYTDMLSTVACEHKCGSTAMQLLDNLGQASDKWVCLYYQKRYQIVRVDENSQD